MGLDPTKHLGQEIAHMQQCLHELNKYAVVILLQISLLHDS